MSLLLARDEFDTRGKKKKWPDDNDDDDVLTLRVRYLALAAFQEDGLPLKRRKEQRERKR